MLTYHHCCEIYYKINYNYDSKVRVFESIRDIYLLQFHFWLIVDMRVDSGILNLLFILVKD